MIKAPVLRWITTVDSTATIYSTSILSTFLYSRIFFVIFTATFVPLLVICSAGTTKVFIVLALVAVSVVDTHALFIPDALYK